MALQLIDVVLAYSWALGGEVLNFVEIVLSVLRSVSIEFVICCLWACEVGSWPWYFLLLLADGVSERGPRPFVHFARERARLRLRAIGVGSGYRLFDSEQIIEVGEFVFRL